MLSALVLTFMVLNLSSCVLLSTNGPYEIKSPCVGADSPWAHNPCSKRPVNNYV